jgi:hypothetical protein
MELGEAGKARVRGYLYVLERSLRSFLPRDVVADAVREIETHVADRVAAVEANPDERTALERILTELGPPLRVAQAYSAELTLDEAIATGRIGATARSLWHFAVNSVAGFFGAIGLFIGYTLGLAFLAIAALKPIFPQNVGFVMHDGWLTGVGAQIALRPGESIVGGYWIIPLCAAIGILMLVGSHRGARRFLGWFRDRRDQRLRTTSAAVQDGAVGRV